MYDATDSDRPYIDQAEAIENLKNEIEEVKRLLRLRPQPLKVASSNDPAPRSMSLPVRPKIEPFVPDQTTQLEALLKIIYSAPGDIVQKTVGDIRNGTPLGTVVASMNQSWTKKKRRRRKDIS